MDLFWNRISLFFALIAMLASFIPISFQASIITSSPDGKDDYVQYKVNKPILEYDSSFNQEQQKEDGQQQDSLVGFDGDVYYSNTKPFWEEPGFQFNQQPPQGNEQANIVTGSSSSNLK